MARRFRPKQKVTDSKSHVQLRRRWRTRLPRLLNEMTDLLAKREIFWDLQNVAKKNPKVLNPAAFFHWLSTNYIIAMTMGARRFVDQSKNSHSLWRMLFEILEHPGVISRRSHTSFYRNTPPGFGNTSFSNIAYTKGRYLPQQRVRSDLRAIENASVRIRRFVNKRVAHLAAEGQLRRAPNFNELDSAFDTIDRILCKYNLLLRGQGMSSAKATRQYDWTEVLTTAWIEKTTNGDV